MLSEAGCGASPSVGCSGGQPNTTRENYLAGGGRGRSAPVVSEAAGINRVAGEDATGRNLGADRLAVQTGSPRYVGPVRQTPPPTLICPECGTKLVRWDRICPLCFGPLPSSATPPGSPEVTDRAETASVYHPGVKL